MYVARSPNNAIERTPIDVRWRYEVSEWSGAAHRER